MIQCLQISEKACGKLRMGLSCHVFMSDDPDLSHEWVLHDRTAEMLLDFLYQFVQQFFCVLLFFNPCYSCKAGAFEHNDELPLIGVLPASPAEALVAWNLPWERFHSWPEAP